MLEMIIKARDEAGPVLKSAGDKLRSFGKSAMSMGSDISNGLRPLTDALRDIGSEAVELASSTEESLNKVRVVFEESSGVIEAWAQNSATAMGISRQKTLEAAGTFGNLFNAMGLSRSESANLSKQVVQLASDLASFNNIKPEEALEKLRAGLVGEAEPLRTLGVNLSVATMESFAMKNGIGEAGKELTDAEKIQARFGLILQQTTSAQGDFTRTSDSLANSLRQQKATQDDVKAQLGESLLPVMKEVTKIVRDATSAFASLSPEMRTVILVISGLLLVAGPLLSIVGLLSGAVGILIGFLTGIGVAGSIVIAAVVLVVAALWQIYETVKVVTDNWDKFVYALRTGQLNEIPVFGFFFSKIQGLMDLIGRLVGLWNGFTSAISNFQMPSITLPSFQIPSFAGGGIVPGPIGAPMPAIVHGGEQIYDPRTGGAGGGGVTVNVTVHGSVWSSADLAEQIETAVRDGVLRGGFRGVISS